MTALLFANLYTSYILERNMYAWIQSLFQMKNSFPEQK